MRSQKRAPRSWEPVTETAAQRNARKRQDRLIAARERGAHSPEQWAAMVAFCGGCVRCGATGPVQKDHIEPIYQGGSDAIDNLQPLCRRCNAAKGPESIDHRPAGWREHLAGAAQ